jgi:uncharacterized protein YceK
MKIALLSALTVTLLSGCSVYGPITHSSGKSGFDGAVYAGQTTQINQPQTTSTLRVFSQSSTGLIPVAAALNDAETRATRHCDQQGKKYRVISETVSTPPHILGNWPRAEIVFECVDK